jgi:FHA domain
MVDRADPPRRPRRPPLPPRARRRWVLAGVAAATWLLFLLTTRSMLAGTSLLLAVAVLAIAARATARGLGISGDHPLVGRLASRPWRNGHDVLMTGLKHLPELFLVTPTGSWLAPNVAEVRMNPGDHAYLTEVMDPALIRSSASEIYQAQVATHAAQPASPGPVSVRVLPDEAVPAGRYRLTPAARAMRVAEAPAGRLRRVFGPAGPGIRDGLTLAEPAGDQTARWGPGDVPTARDDRRPPSLRLVTGKAVVHTRRSGARAGRGSSVELRLPQEDLTISRVHANFTFSDGRWWITGTGRNGLLLNGSRLTARREVSSGDCVSWGTHANAVVSQIQVDV